MKWKAFKTKAKGKNPSYNIKRIGGGCVAKINSSMVEGNERNSKLIAAAPEMYDALDKIECAIIDWEMDWEEEPKNTNILIERLFDNLKVLKSLNVSERTENGTSR